MTALYPLTCTVVLLVPMVPAPAQTLSWVGQIGGTDHESVFDACHDATGNLFTTGFFRGTPDFDPGPGNYPVTGIGVDNIYVAKYDPSHAPLWVARMGGGEWLDCGYAVATGPSGEVVVTGNFFGSGDFDPGPGIHMLTAVEESDVFVVKLDANGIFQWAVQFGDSLWSNGWDIAIDPFGNALVTGRLSDTTDVDPGPGVELFNALGSDGFVIKLDPNGALVWAKKFGDGTLPERGYRITCDGIGDVFFMGEFAVQMDADPGPGVFMLDEADGSNYVMKLDPGGNFIWARQFGAQPTDWGATGADFVMDGTGNCYIAGALVGSADMDPGPGDFILTSLGMWDVFCMKLTPVGALAWAFSLGGAGGDQAMDLTLIDEDLLLLSASYEGPIDLDPGPASLTSISYGQLDAFLLGLDTSGTLIGAMTLGGTGDDYLNGTTSWPGGQLIGYGSFESTVDFDPGPGANFLTAFGGSDAFIGEYADFTSSLVEHVMHATPRVWPNPTEGLVQMTGVPASTDGISVLDVLGHQVLYEPIAPSPASNVILELGVLPDGVYWLQQIPHGGQVTTPIIVMR